MKTPNVDQLIVKPFPRTKTEYLKLVESLHFALERDLVMDFHQYTVPQLKDQILQLEDRLASTPDGDNAKKNAREAAQWMPDGISILVNFHRNFP